MKKIYRKISEESSANINDVGSSIGPSLKKLRNLSGFTQAEMASKLNVQQSAISRIENADEHQISSIKKYVEALGAQFRIDASFSLDSELSVNIKGNFDGNDKDKNQPIFSILGDDPFPNKRDVVLSIKPHYTDKIMEGLKTVELRRRFPVSAPQGTLAYIYSTSPVMAMVAMAEIQDVLKLPIEKIWQDFSKSAFIERDKFDRYFDGIKEGYALKFINVRAFHRPLNLSELRSKFGFEPPQSYLYAKHNLRKALNNEQAIVSN